MMQVNIDIGTFVSWLKVLGLLAFVVSTTVGTAIGLVAAGAWFMNKVGL